MSLHFCVWGLFVYTPVLCAQDAQPPQAGRGGENSKSPMLMATLFDVIIHQWLKILLVSTCTDLRI